MDVVDAEIVADNGGDIADVEYTFTVIIEFIGGAQVRVTLLGVNRFTLDIVKDDVS